MDREPLVSVSIVNYNGRRFLPEFFNSLFKQTYKNFEVIFVDNSSTDDSIDYVRRNYPQVMIIENKDNSGYAEGNNIGYKNSKGEFILVINNDTTLKEDLIEKMLKAFDEIPNLGTVQPMVKLMNEKEKLDACGSFWTNTGFNYHYGIYKKASLSIYHNSFPVYSIKGMCMMIPRSVIEKLGLFDSDFWCYFEETDFCHRLWLAGYECWYYPKTFIYHHMGGTSSKKPPSFIQFHSFKNRLCSYLKNLGAVEMMRVLPIYFFFNFVWSVAFLIRLDTANFFVVYRAVWWNVVHFRETMDKREKIQKEIREKTDREIFSKVRWNPKLYYYLCLFKGLGEYVDESRGNSQYKIMNMENKYMQDTQHKSLIICPICKESKTSFKFNGRDVYEKLVSGSFKLFQCHKCECIFQFPMPGGDKIGTFYANNYYSYQVGRKKSFFDKVRENTIRVNYEGTNNFPFLWKVFLLFTRKKFRDILPMGRQGGKFLDIGCGDSINLRILRDYNWDTYGIEISEEAVKDAQAKNLQVARSTLEDYSPGIKFDAIRLWHVLEHLPDPHASMEKLRSLLREKGIVYIAIPNTKSLNAYLFGKYWIGYDVPRHLINYSIKSLKVLLAKHNFTLLGYKHASTAGLLCSISNFINGVTKRKLRLANNPFLVILMYPYDFITDLIGLGDTLYIKIKKNETS